ncbi:paraquat-inducible protein A [Blastopirellula sp. JC732]|uniref:Paraquat-inducible protein A n=1 Tax=Blastopirellula sediminis TaxID=2894196 RepID=A0A9X1MS63_9BACT|nr:paraquat-inducible protein A [Blastopirellula sediminis]MCC9605086.1 paraquat-inducible protein A [Blastopirellula sediminis]MCC9631614.1 paraquat-inducible protein A [Blastopirellula sediminis]
MQAILRNWRVWCMLFTTAAAVCFVAGLALPFVQVSPGEKLGPIEGLVVWFISDDNTYSLMGSITAIWHEHTFLGAIAFAFSIMLPTLKLLVLTLSALRLSDMRRIAFYRAWAERMGPWSMLEVFLVAFSLLLTKSLPFGTAIHPLEGFYFFWASIILSLIAALTLPRGDRVAVADSSPQLAPSTE